VFSLRYGLNSYITFRRASTRSQYVFGRSCYQPTQSKFCVVFLGSRANAELVPKFHVTLHASHASFPMLTSRCHHVLPSQGLLPEFCGSVCVQLDLTQLPSLLHFSFLLSFPNILPPLQPTFTRSTRWHCLGTFIAQ
jgi:hypothetical protein